MIFKILTFSVEPIYKLLPGNNPEYLKAFCLFWPIEFKKSSRSPRSGISGGYSVLEAGKQNTVKNKSRIFPAGFIAGVFDTRCRKLLKRHFRGTLGECCGNPANSTGNGQSFKSCRGHHFYFKQGNQGVLRFLGVKAQRCVINSVTASSMV
jgi:hypothetical protein